jgi:phosphatidylserine/phosphatidylglycerophosphate/cardiolipin synthase-like enzyme
VRAAVRQIPRRLTIVSPWINYESDCELTLSVLIRHAVRNRAAVVVITRPPTSAPHRRAVELVQAAPRSRIYLNPHLHAKLYICESAHGRGFAVVGSANGTISSASLDEVAILLRPEGASSIIRELAGPTVRGLMDKRLPKR